MKKNYIGNLLVKEGETVNSSNVEVIVGYVMIQKGGRLISPNLRSIFGSLTIDGGYIEAPELNHIGKGLIIKEEVK